MTQPCEFDDPPLPSTPIPQQTYPYNPGMVMWGLLFLAVAIYEAWAVVTGHPTLSQTVQHGPKWFKWALALGLIGLFVHLFRPQS
jgi:hypothetical protein